MLSGWRRIGWRLAGVACAAGLAWAGASPSRAADDPAATAPGRMLHGDPNAPDISGLWLGTYTSSPGYIPYVPVPEVNKTHWSPWPSPLTAAYKAKADEIAAADKAGRTLGDGGAKCLPFGLPFVVVLGSYPNEIVQTPGQVLSLIHI